MKMSVKNFKTSGSHKIMWDDIFCKQYVAFWRNAAEILHTICLKFNLMFN